MFDRSRPYGGSPGSIKPDINDASSDHYWLMRRDLRRPRPPVTWPELSYPLDFCFENAPAVHQLLTLGTDLGGGRVADFATWLSGFEDDPEFDPGLCFVVQDPSGVVAVAQCWRSAFIRNLVVHPRMQRRSVGLALLNHIFETFATRREGHVDLKVMESNLTARRLYERAEMYYVQRRELERR